MSISNLTRQLVTNLSGGLVHKITPETLLNRYLIMGFTSNKISTESKATEDPIDISEIIGLIESRGPYVVDTIVHVSDSGRAKNNDPALKLLALCLTYGNTYTKRLAGDAVMKVVRTGTHLFHFVDFLNHYRGWGRAAKRAVASWYTGRTNNALTTQLLKYKQRDGWSHRDVMRLAHPKPPRDNETASALYKYAVRGFDAVREHPDLPGMVHVVEALPDMDEAGIIPAIRNFNITHEMLPTEMKNNPNVWKALIPNMGLTALLRNLNKITSLGILSDSNVLDTVIHKLVDEGGIRANRIHPLSVLIAWQAYGTGGQDSRFLSNLTWFPNQDILQALEVMFYSSFQFIIPSGKNHLLALDVSGSMGSNYCIGAPLISCAMASSVMAMATVRSEPNCRIMGFSHQLVDLGITKEDTLNETLKKVMMRNFGGTDAGIPVDYALQHKLDIDCFSIYTDNETYAHRSVPSAQIKKYRGVMNKPDTKLVVCGMAVSNFSIADPNDFGMLDLAGFDAATPSIISDFSANLF